MRDKFKKPRRRAPARRRRATTKRPNRRGQTSITHVKGSVMPDKMIVKFPYFDYQKVNAAGSSATPNYFQKTYSLNGLYDPEPGAINTFPLGYLEWSQLYQRYRVFAVSYELTLWNGSDDTSVVGALYINDAGGTGGMNSNVTSWLTQPRSRPISLGNKSGGKSQQVFRGKVYCPGYLGLTAEQAKELFKADPQAFFTKMLENVKNSQNSTMALDALNIKETREVNTIQKLSENMDVYNSSMADAAEAYKNGTFLSEAYGKSQDNVATKITLLQNQFKTLQDSIGEALGPGVGVALDSAALAQQSNHTET